MDISDLIRQPSSGLALSILNLDEDLNLNTYDKILLVRHWILAGRPEEVELKLIETLGFDWDDYMNPFLVKLYECDLLNLLVHNEEYDSLNDPRYDKILKEIFTQKLVSLESDVAPRGYDSKVSDFKYGQFRQGLSFNIVSLRRNYELFHFSATVEGYNFTPNIRLFDRPEDLTYLLTEQSVTNLKGVMYYMTENENWDRSLLPKSLGYLSFKKPLLNHLAKAIVDKYLTSELVEKFEDKSEEDDTTNLGGITLMPYDPDDDED